MVTATLKEAFLIPRGDGTVISGAIYGDTKGRWQDGERVITSFVKDQYENADGSLSVRTLHNTYRVELAKGEK